MVLQKKLGGEREDTIDSLSIFFFFIQNKKINNFFFLGHKIPLTFALFANSNPIFGLCKIGPLHFN